MQQAFTALMGLFGDFASLRELAESPKHVILGQAMHQALTALVSLFVSALRADKAEADNVSFSLHAHHQRACSCTWGLMSRHRSRQVTWSLQLRKCG